MRNILNNELQYPIDVPDEAFNHDIKIDGNSIPAGKYSIHMVPGEKEFEIMFNKVNDAWGSYSYDASQNAITIKVKPVSNENTEWMEFGFEELSDTGATAYLKWADKKIPFKIQL